MTSEQTFLLDVLADYINKRKTTVPDELDWPALLTYAKNHQVEGILYDQCKEFIPAVMRTQLTQLYLADLFYYTNRVRQLEEISRELSAHKIPFYTVKGLDVAALYPVPALRTMGDCDIVVHPEDKDSAHEIMLSLGFDNQSKQGAEWTYFKNNLEFEIHDHLLYDEVVNSQISKDFTELAWEYAQPAGDGSRCELKWDFHFVFLLLHLKKHFLNSGVGFRQFMDLVVVVQHRQLDWAWIEAALSKLELLDFAKICCAFCERWFDVSMPLTAELDEVFYEASTQKIFGNGVFGFDDESNKENAVLNSVQHLGKVKSIVTRFFPKYKDMRYVPHYAFLNGRPWLLPAAWVYRFVRSVFYKKTAAEIRRISCTLNSDDALDERKNKLKQWGL